MAGDIDLRMLGKLEFGSVYFEKDGDLHASDRGGFCPFPHPSKRVTHVNGVLDGQLVQVAMPTSFVEQLIAIAEQQDETDRLIAAQQRAARRFRQNRKLYHARVSAA